MKKLVTLCLVMLSFSAFAQLPINIGLKGGVNYSLINTEGNGLTTAGDPGYLGGAFVRLKVKKFTAQAEGLLVGVRGTSERIDLISQAQNSVEDQISYSNFDVPVMVGYRFLDLEVIKFGVNGGVVQSFNALKGGDKDNFDFEDSYTSGVIGVALDIPFFIFDLRYQHAFGDFATYNQTNTTLSDGLSNGLISFSVAWKII